MVLKITYTLKLYFFLLIFLPALACSLAVASATEVPETFVEEQTTTPVTSTPSVETVYHPEVDVVEVPETEQMSELEMLACVIYQEAGADYCCDDCRRRVGDVVLNRIADERFPNTMYEVLTQKRQYGRFYWTDIVWPDRAQKPEEAHAVARAYRIAEELLSGQHSELYNNGYIWQAEFEQGTGIIKCCNIYYGK